MSSLILLPWGFEFARHTINCVLAPGTVLTNLAQVTDKKIFMLYSCTSILYDGFENLDAEPNKSRCPSLQSDHE